MLDEACARARFAAALDNRPFELSRREARWLALAGDVVAFAADDAAGWERLACEAWLLARWRAAGIPAPRVIREDAARGIQILERLHGRTGAEIHSETGTSPLYPGTIPDAAARTRGLPGASAVGGGKVTMKRASERASRADDDAALLTPFGELAARIRHAIPLAASRS